MQDEFAGLGSLGEPATAATIAAASGIMGAIAGLLKNIGSLFKKKDKAAKGGASSEGGGSDSGSGDEGGSDAGGDSVTTDENGGTITAQDSGGSLVKENADGSSEGGAASSAFSADGSGKTSFWEKNKKWLLPASIGLGILTIYGLYKMSSKGKTSAMSGLPNSKKKKHKIKSKKKDAIALL
jgi:hypothetical protein